MSNVEPDDLEFRGEDLKECERFISAVTKKARAEGKFRDDQWIADLVGASMAGDALIWWSSLDDEIQESWKLLRKAMLSRYRLHFAGKSATEAEDFVHWIRQRALDAGKLNDPSWTAELASGCFVGGALRWYTALDPGIRGSWDSLQQAIFAQYSEESEEGFTLPMVPTPAPAAAAPNPPKSRARGRNRVQRDSNVQYSEGSEESLLLRMAPAPALAAAAPNTPAPRIRGRIRVRRENDREIYYLSRVLPTATPDPGQVIATPRMAEALEVEYDAFPPDDTKTLFIPNNQLPGRDALGLKWYTAKTSAPLNFLVLCGVTLSSGTGSPGPSYVGPVLTKLWRISWSPNGQGAMPVGAISESGVSLLASSYSEAKGLVWFRTQKPLSEIRLELFFEPV